MTEAEAVETILRAPAAILRACYCGALAGDAASLRALVYEPEEDDDDE